MIQFSDPFALLDADEDEIVNSIVSGMLKKDLVGDAVLKDLGFEDKKKNVDPTVKINLRHQQVLFKYITVNCFEFILF